MRAIRFAVLGLAGALLASACGGQSPRLNQGSAQANWHPPRLPSNEEKLGLAGLAAGLAVTESVAYRAVTGSCYAQCQPPSVCDKASGLCVSEKLKVKPHPAPGSPAAHAPDVEPTCAGLCLPNERCAVMKDGVQDCVKITPGSADVSEP